ncbi:hypothetical protein D3C80_1764610 [compost metagenome]
MGNRVGYRSARAGQRGLRGRQVEALLQVLQVLSALVVQFIGHQRDALTMVVVVPLGQCVAQPGDLGIDLCRAPVGAFAGVKSGCVNKQQQREQQHDRHGQHPCMAKRESSA